MDGWALVRTDKLDEELLRLLLDNRIAAILVPGFLSENTAAAALRGIQQQPFDYYQDVSPPIGRLGITQYEHRHGAAAREAYLAEAVAANLRRQQVLADSGDLAALVLQELGKVWPRPVGIAAEPDGREYFAGLIRMIGQALLHCDWAPHDAMGWGIESVTAQLTWNVYCSMPERGGATIVYHRQWDDGAERFLLEDSYGYRPALVAGVPSVRIEAAGTDLVLFNSRNFHEVEAGSGDVARISVSSFIGRTPSDDLVAWS